LKCRQAGQITPAPRANMTFDSSPAMSVPSVTNCEIVLDASESACAIVYAEVAGVVGCVGLLLFEHAAPTRHGAAAAASRTFTFNMSVD
jgi:hypothetical protein